MATLVEPPLRRWLAFEILDGVYAFSSVNQSVVQVGVWNV